MRCLDINQQDLWKKKLLIGGSILFFAFFSMTIRSMTSFMYPLHDRVDQNVFFTIGREMLNGKVVYTDLAEQKGPYVYLFNALAAAISSSSMIGIYLFQVVSFALFVYFCYKIAQHFLSDSQSLMAALLTGMFVITTNCFLRGDNVEEPAFMLMALSIWLMLRKETKPAVTMLINGLAVGLLFWVKFNLLGFWLGWFILYFGRLAKEKQWTEIFKRFAVFMSGFLLMAIIPVVYGVLTGSLMECFYQYFYANIFLYSGEITMLERLEKILIGFGKNFIQNPAYFVLIHIGLVSMIRKKDFWGVQFRNTLLLGYLVMYTGCYFSGVWYDYYYLITAVYSLFGVIFLMHWFSQKQWKVGKCLYKFSILAYVLILAYVVLFGNGILYYGKKKADYPQVQFAQIIQSRGGDSLLNYGFIDQGFYLASGISPSNKYFSKMNIPKESLPEMYEDQWNQIENQTVDFVVIRMKKNESFEKYKEKEIFKYYKIIAYAESIGDNYRFALLERIDLD